MTFSIIFLISMTFDVIGQDYTPGVEDYLLKFLIPLLNPTKTFDGPTSVSNQPTTSSLNRLPAIDQMMYYNYYAASTNFLYDHNDFSCVWCLKIKPDLTAYEVALSKVRQEIVVAFRGSVNIWNFFLNTILSCNTVPGRRNSDNIKIHGGYYIAAMSLYPDVVEKVSSHLKEHKKFKIVLTGHSMGGALAILTYFFLIDLNQFPGVEYELYTYGEPRVGNKAFADFMNSQPVTSARVVARGDIVPHFPPTSVFGSDVLIGDNYVHPQTEFWINGKVNQKFANQSFYEDPNCSMSMGPLYNLLDHYLYFDINVALSGGQPFQMLCHSTFLIPFEIYHRCPKKLRDLCLMGELPLYEHLHRCSDNSMLHRLTNCEFFFLPRNALTVKKLFIAEILTISL